MDQSINDSKSHIWNYFIENIIFGIQLFYIHPHVPADIMQVFFDYRFSRRKSQSQQKLLIKITYFAIQVRSKNLTHFTNFNSLDIENNMPPKHCQKSFSLYKFFRKHVSVWCLKKTFARHHFLTPKNCILEGLWKQMLVYFCVSD